jgi:hypothetical protein
LFDFDKILEKINEESQHPAITNLNRIKSENEKEETNYFKSLNKGIQDGIKDTENGAKFEYEYDDLPKGDENMDEDLLAAGIVDPTKVTRSALQNAASAASMFLTTQAVVADIPEPAKNDSHGGGGMGMGGGMPGMMGM